MVNGITVHRLVVLLMMMAAALAGGPVTAQNTPTLVGPRVITLPYVYVPFLQSKLEIVQGERNASTKA